MGGLRYWHDGRDVPDIMLGMFEYPETKHHPAFNLSLRSNFTDGSGGGRHTRLVGSEGEMVLAGDTVILRKGRMPANPGMSIGDFSEDVRQEYEEYYKENFPEPEPLVYVTTFENEISELLAVLVFFLFLTSLLEMLFILLDTLLDLRLLKIHKKDTGCQRKTLVNA